MGRKIILFLGAGASASFGYPTTEDFLDGLRAELGQSNEGTFLSIIRKIGDIKDVEHVLELLQAFQTLNIHPLREFFTTYPSQTVFPTDRGAVGFQISDQFKIMESLFNRIKDDVYRQYEKLPGKTADISRTYTSLIETINDLSQSNRTVVFTTNYDCVIEEFCASQKIKCVDGFKHNQNLRRYEWEASEFSEAFRKFGRVNLIKDGSKHYHSLGEKSVINLFKLHGSLDWRLTYDDKIIRETSQSRVRNTRQFKENILIYPAEKVKPSIEPFSSLHEWFKRFYNQTDAIVFIGFALRDAYLNEIIMGNRNAKNKKLIFVSRHANRFAYLEKTFPGKTSLINCDFGKEPDISDRIATELKR